MISVSFVENHLGYSQEETSLLVGKRTVLEKEKESVTKSGEGRIPSIKPKDIGKGNMETKTSIEEMPLSEMQRIKISEIIVEDRARQDIGDLEGLKKSIIELGLIQPIVIDANSKLVVGARRLQACRELKIHDIPVVRKGGPDVTPAFLTLCELSENIHRKNFSPFEEAECRSKYHRLKELSGGKLEFKGRSSTGQSIAKSAEELGIERKTLQQDRMVMAAVEMMPDLKKEDSKSAILSKWKREMIKRISERIAILAHETTINEVFIGDVKTEIQRVKTGSVALILTDIPYGIDPKELSSEGWQFEKRQDDTYFEDGIDLKGSIELIENLIDDFHRVLIDGGMIFMCCAIEQWFHLRKSFQAVGFLVRSTPFVWDKQNGFNANPGKSIPFCWEPLLVMSKGSPRGFSRIVTDDIFSCPVPNEKIHINQKPVDLGKHIVEIASYQNELILDPFCGSGSFLVAGKKLNRRVIGIDKNQHCGNLSITALTIVDVIEETEE